MKQYYRKCIQPLSQWSHRVSLVLARCCQSQAVLHLLVWLCYVSILSQGSGCMKMFKGLQSQSDKHLFLGPGRGILCILRKTKPHWKREGLVNRRKWNGRVPVK